jgi:SagB-type dehydrogenase family enzyme
VTDREQERRRNTDIAAVRQFHNATKYIAVPNEAGEEQFLMGTPPDLENAIWQEDWSIEPIPPYKFYETIDPMDLPREFAATTMPALEAISRNGSEPQGTRVPDLEVLARISLLSNGILKQGAHRPNGVIIEYRASGGTGARYHLELYFVCGDIQGLEAGIYHYSAQDHSFRQLRKGDFRGVLVEATGGEESIASAPVIMAMTSTFWRNAWRYKARAYRHSLWDAGTTLTNVLALSASAELPTKLVLGFADVAVNDLLGVDGHREATLALCAIGRNSGTVPSAPDVSPIDHPVRVISEREIDFPLIGMMHHASELDSGSDAATWRGNPLVREPSDPQGKLVPLQPLAAADLPVMPVEDVIRRRRSTRNYDTDTPIGFDLFSTLVDRSNRGFASDCLVPGARPLHDQYLIVNSVEGLEPGAYRVHPDRNAIELVRSGEFRPQAKRLAADQEYAANAHVNSYYLTELDPVLAHFGNRGYRVAQLEAALYGSRLHLGTHSLGLGAVGSTSFDDEVVEFFTPGSNQADYMFVLVFGKRKRKTS